MGTTSSRGKYAGKLGMENFRRPLRKDARSGMPAGFKRYMRHDFYWGFLGHLGPIAFFAWTVHLVSGGFDSDQPGVSPEQRERNKRLLQVHGDDDPMSPRMPWSREIAKAQIRAFISGDPVWEEAVHRDWINPSLFAYFKWAQGYDPVVHEYIPIPVQFRPPNNRFDFHEDKLAKREASIAARGHYTMSYEERRAFMKEHERATRDSITREWGNGYEVLLTKEDLDQLMEERLALYESDEWKKPQSGWIHKLAASKAQ